MVQSSNYTKYDEDELHYIIDQNAPNNLIVTDGLICQNVIVIINTNKCYKTIWKFTRLTGIQSKNLTILPLSIWTRHMRVGVCQFEALPVRPWRHPNVNE